MQTVFQATRLNEQPHYFRDDRHADSIRELLQTDARPREVDLRGLQGFFRRRPDGTRTCVAGVRRVPAGCDLIATAGSASTAFLKARRRPLPPTGAGPLGALEQSMRDLLQQCRRPVVALSGGLDSALVYALARKVAGGPLPCLTLASGLPAYCEIEDTRASARRLEVRQLDVKHIGARDLIDALPDAIAACETPLFNLHPVSKLLLARAAGDLGYDALLTGDGADQVFARADGRNYIPLIGAIVRSTGVALLSPFFDEQVTASARQLPLDQNKTVLRRAAETLLPSEIMQRPKQPRLAPDLTLSHFRNVALEAALAPRLRHEPPPDEVGRAQTLWATTALLFQTLGLDAAPSGDEVEVVAPQGERHG